MPSDIRSFFAPKSQSSQDTAKLTTKPAPAAKKNAAGRSKKRVIVDSDDEGEEEVEEVASKKTTPKKKPVAPPKKEEEAVETSAYFAGKNKVSRTAPTKVSKPAPVKKIIKAPKKSTKEEKYILSDDDEDFGDDIFAAEFKKHADEDDEPRRKKKNTALLEEDIEMIDVDDNDDDDDDDFVMQVEKVEKVKPKNKPTAVAGTKRKNTTDDEGSSDEKPAKAVKTATARKSAAPKKTPIKTNKKREEADTSEVKKILDSIPTVRLPTPPPKDGDKKFNYRDFKAREARAPPSGGTKEIPTGETNCLAGLTFVFTGQLDSLSREDGQQLVKRYGGRVTGAPSKKTSFVVLGNDAGPSKLAIIRTNNLKTINEDGLYQLIRTLPANGGDSKLAQAAETKRLAEEKKVMELAKEMARTMIPSSKETGKGKVKEAGKVETSLDTQLWTVKYAPTSITHICGNKGQVEKLQRWLRNWHKNAKVSFKNKGEDGTGTHRAIMIYGPPGIGKTTAAHLAAKLEGYDIVESNASDTRSKKLMEASLKGVLDNKSLMGYFGRGSAQVDASKQNLLLIMDEVDGMSAGDRGGVGQLASICRKTSIPIICICNDRRLTKMKPFDQVTFDLAFKRPGADAIRSRMASIAFREGLKLPPNVIDALVEGSGSDIRQIINMISTFAVSAKNMDFDEGKKMSKAWEKHVVLKPWDIASKLLGPAMFAPNAHKSLNDKLELYFNDHEFSYLMIQENYLKTYPARSNTLSGKHQKNLENLGLIEAAAASISDGDLVDAMIHGPQQHWSLMPVHGILSTVSPSSYAYGAQTGQFSFTSWLGMNSKQSKLSRLLHEIQSHMRLRASGDCHEIRQSYIPILWSLLGKSLELNEKQAISKVIELMDSYYLTREDFDTIIELGLGDMSEKNLKIPTQVKTAFTKEYNSMPHPLPFIKSSPGSTAPAIAGGKARKEVPDLEEAIEESEDEAILADDDDDDDLDLTKDKYVKAKKPGAKARPAAAKKTASSSKAKTAPKTPKGKGKGKGKKDIDSDDDDEEDVRPIKKTAAAAKRKAKGSK